MTTHKINVQLREEILVLNKHFQSLLTFLRENKRKRIPLHIILGSKGNGKTSLLRNSEVEFSNTIPAIKTYKKDLAADNSSFHFSDTNLTTKDSSEYCHWWINKDGVILDIPGDWLENEEPSVLPLLWQRLLKLLQKHKNDLIVHSVIYVISIEQLVSLEKDAQATWLQIQKQRLLELSKWLSIKLPLYFLISKCDLLNGFKEFFDDLRTDERTQCFGCSLNQMLVPNPSEKPTQPTLTDIFNINFDYLVNQLNAYVITRIHQERNLNKKALIKEFPLQFESLQNITAKIIIELGEKTQYCDATNPQGIYFNSALQDNESIIDRLQSSLNQSFEFALQPYQTYLAHESRAYFINNFFGDLLANPQALAQVKGNKPRINIKIFKLTNKNTLGITAAAAAIFSLSIGLITWQYQTEKTNLEINKNSLVAFQKQLVNINPQAMSINEILTSLNLITQVHDQVHKRSMQWSLFNLFKKNNIEQSIDQTYKESLEKLLLPEIKQNLENELLTENDPVKLYGELKAYLMLGNSHQRDDNYLIQWALNCWGNTLNDKPNLKRVLLTDMENLLAQNKSFALNPLAITQARTALTNLPPQYLGYITILNQAHNQLALPFSVNNLTLDKHIIIENDKGIPYLYTVNGFNQIFLKEFSLLINGASNDSWMFNDNTRANPLRSMAQYQDQILDLYFKDYINWWQNYVYNHVFATPNSLNTIISKLTAFAQSPMLLHNILQTISNNVAEDKLVNSIALEFQSLKPVVQAAIIRNYTPQFIAANQAFIALASDSNQYNEIESSLDKLTTYLGAIQASADPSQSAFELAALHANGQDNTDPLNNLFTLATTQPQPIQDWLQNTATATWKTVLSLTKNYLNEQWQTLVIPQYNNNINNKFPIFNTATTDITLNDFSQFFSPDGTLSQYFNHFLKPFVDTSSVQWQWKTINGLTLPIDNAIPQLFERARIIRQMFFPDNNDTLAVSFSLIPNVISPMVTKIQLSLNGISMIATQGQHIATNFTWPGSSVIDSVTVLLGNPNQQQMADSKSSPFALFRLFNEAQLQTTADPKKYLLNFTVNSNPTAQYQLIANNIINPFIPNIVDQFRCPAVL